MGSKSFLLIMLVPAWISAMAQGKKDGLISMQMGANDSMHTITATVTDIATKAPLKGVEITFYLQRTFGIMKVGNGTTDTTGVISAEFPLSIPSSDTLGSLVVLAKVEDNAVINDTTFRVVTKTKVSYPAHTPVKAGLISSVAPLWLKFSFWLIVIMVWGSFVYTLYLIGRIKASASKKIIIN
jgi:hypothetical protein